MFLAAAPAVAQNASWDMSFAPYLWATGIDGNATVGGVTADLQVNFSDILHVLEGGLTGHFEARKGDNGLFGDVIYFELEPEDGIELGALILEAGYFHGSDNGAGLAGLEVGGRYWDFETTLDFALAPALTRDANWVDGFIGYRRERPVGENWRSVLRGNIGTGGSELTWGVDLTYLYDYANGNALAVGLKWLDIDFEKQQHFGIDAHLFGATVGYKFD